MYVVFCVFCKKIHIFYLLFNIAHLLFNAIELSFLKIMFLPLTCEQSFLKSDLAFDKMEFLSSGFKQ